MKRDTIKKDDIQNMHVKGGNMGTTKDMLEIDRIRNLIINFDWKIVKQETTEKLVVLTIQKDRIQPEITVDLGAS